MTARAVLAALAAATMFCSACRPQSSDNQQDVVATSITAERPTLFLLTSLPLLFPEDMRLDADGPAVTQVLEPFFRINPVDVPAQLPEGAILLAVQPRALPAESLVALDEWVRRGGRIVLLADPMLEWPSKRPLGDKLRPAMAYPDTGLLAHWGLRLDAPEERGPRRLGEVGSEAVYVSPGKLVATGKACRIEQSGVIARCRIGKGQAIVVADADWLNEELVLDGGGQPDQQFGQLVQIIESLAPRH